jgi:hypothetical protein
VITSALRPALFAAIVAAHGGCGAPTVLTSSSATHERASDSLEGAQRVVSVVHDDATAIVRDALGGRSAVRLPELTRAFYADHGDDYDFLFLVPAVTVSERAMGKLYTVRAPARPWLGSGAVADEEFGSAARLKAVIILDHLAESSGPMLHELFHYWGVFLDARLGFGRGRAGRVGPHWGFASVAGQVGGFAAEGLSCEHGEPLPCRPGGDGRIALATARPWSPYANGGDTVPYAPLELYLMGLLPAAEVPPTLVLDDALHVASHDDGAMSLTAAGVHTVTVTDITALHGAVPPAEQTAFRAAFVIVTEELPRPEAFVVVDRWARRMAGDVHVAGELSFAQATRGHATLDTSIP